MVALVIGAKTYRLSGAAGSAIKGVQILPPTSMNSKCKLRSTDRLELAVSVGYDQRLSLWSLFRPYSEDMQESGPDSENLDCAESMSSPFSRVEIADSNSEVSPIMWETGAVVNVTDICSLASSLSVASSEQIDLAVIGEGVQMFRLENKLG